MNQQEFLQKAKELGYGHPETLEFDPNHSGGDMHDHEFSAIAMVTEGVFTMKYEDGDVAYKAGDWYEVPAGTMHTAKTGTEGAKLLFGKK